MATKVHALRPSITRTRPVFPAITPAGKRADGARTCLALAEAGDV